MLQKSLGSLLDGFHAIPTFMMTFVSLLMAIRNRFGSPKDTYQAGEINL